MAAGYLQWSPEVIWEAPISQIFLALEGRAEFVIATNPFGGGSSKRKSKKADAEAQKKARTLEKNKVRALKFDMMQFNLRQKNMKMGKPDGSSTVTDSN